MTVKSVQSPFRDLINSEVITLWKLVSNFTFVPFGDWPLFSFALMQTNAKLTSFHRCQRLLLSTLQDHTTPRGAVVCSFRAMRLWVTATQHTVAGVARYCHPAFLIPQTQTTASMTKLADKITGGMFSQKERWKLVLSNYWMVHCKDWTRGSILPVLIWGQGRSQQRAARERCFNFCSTLHQGFVCQHLDFCKTHPTGIADVG